MYKQNLGLLKGFLSQELPYEIAASIEQTSLNHFRKYLAAQKSIFSHFSFTVNMVGGLGSQDGC